MKILFHAPPAWSPTGYGKQTRYFAKALAERGHEVAVLAYHQLEYARVEWEGSTHYPGGRERYSLDVLGATAKHWGAKHVVSIVDSFVVQNAARMCKADDLQWLPWCPIDQDPLPSLIKSAIKNAQSGLKVAHVNLREVERDRLMTTRGALDSIKSLRLFVGAGYNLLSAA